MPVSRFALDVCKWSGDAEEKLERVVKTVEIEMFSRIVLRSPVDTGRFRGNWNIEQSVTTEEIDKSGAITIDRMTVNVLASEVGGVTSYINALPYAERLELGHSKQAPGGMVRLVALEFGAIVEEAARS